MPYQIDRRPATVDRPVSGRPSTVALFCPIPRTRADGRPFHASLDSNRPPATIVLFVTWVITDRILRPKVVRNPFVHARQIRKRLHRIDSPARALGNRSKLTPRELVQPFVDLPSRLRRQRHARPESPR